MPSQNGYSSLCQGGLGLISAPHRLHLSAYSSALPHSLVLTHPLITTSLSWGQCSFWLFSCCRISLLSSLTHFLVCLVLLASLHGWLLIVTIVCSPLTVRLGYLRAYASHSCFLPFPFKDVCCQTLASSPRGLLKLCANRSERCG